MRVNYKRWRENEIIDVYDSSKHWSPNLFIENVIQLSKEEISYQVEKTDDEQTIVTEVRKVKGVFWERLELQNFPFDLQELSIILTSNRDHSEIKLVSDKLRLSQIDFGAKNTFIDQQKW